MNANIINTQIFHDLKGHKSSFNFIVNLHLVLSSPLFLLLSHSISPFALCKNYSTHSEMFYICSISICHSHLRKVILRIRLSSKAFWCCFLIRPLFTHYFAIREILRGIKGEIFSPSIFFPLSLLLSFSLSFLLFFSLSLLLSFFSLSPSLSPFYLYYSLAYLMDVFVLVHNIKYDLKGHIRPDLLIKLQP